MTYHDILIIGGGASGLMTAIIAKDLGKDVAIIESTSRVGNKILTTGNGRCNISNKNIAMPFDTYHSSNKNFHNFCLNNFTVDDMKNFFLSLGLPIVELEKGKLFPESLQASSVVDILRMRIEESDIPVYKDCKVKEIIKVKKFKILTTNDEFTNFTCNKLILACGGKSAPKTGSDGSGFKLAKELGHKIIKPVPGIVQLKLNYPHLKALSGIKINNGSASILVNDKLIRKDVGEILFTDYGISGPPILQISAIASKALSNNNDVKIKVDMMPNKTFEEVDNFIQGHLAVFSHRSISEALIGIINKKMIPILLKDIGLSNIHTPCYDVDWKYKNLLSKRFKDWTFTCTNTNGFNSAQLTCGGVDTRDVIDTSLESKLIKNLFFTGEILDVNGDCGGFNLHWAWCSAYLVGNSL